MATVALAGLVLPIRAARDSMLRDVLWTRGDGRVEWLECRCIMRRPPVGGDGAAW
jgi:hypothetical protein